MRSGSWFNKPDLSHAGYRNADRPAFRKLIDGGGSLIVIEHNLDVIKCADWVIDLGPEGGEGGGRIVAEGTPEEIAGNLMSHTGKWLARVL